MGQVIKVSTAPTVDTLKIDVSLKITFGELSIKAYASLTPEELVSTEEFNRTVASLTEILKIKLKKEARKWYG